MLKGGFMSVEDGNGSGRWYFINVKYIEMIEDTPDDSPYKSCIRLPTDETEYYSKMEMYQILDLLHKREQLIAGLLP